MEMEQKSEIYPSNRGHKWTEAEESLLLEELNNGLSLDVIAKSHGRTIGGISSRCKEIAYKMYLKEISMEEIVKQTKLDEEAVKEWIEKKQNKKTKKNDKKEKAKEEKESKETKEGNGDNKSDNNNLDIIEMKNDIKDIKKSIEYIMDLISDLNHSINNINNK